MKRLALVAAVLCVAACSPKNDAATDTAAAVPAAAPATPTDTGMVHDSTAKADSAKADSVKADTTKKP